MVRFQTTLDATTLTYTWKEIESKTDGRVWEVLVPNAGLWVIRNGVLDGNAPMLKDLIKPDHPLYQKYVEFTNVLPHFKYLCVEEMRMQNEINLFVFHPTKGEVVRRPGILKEDDFYHLFPLMQLDINTALQKHRNETMTRECLFKMEAILEEISKK